jgi:AcrR family transcriptional regulator
VPRPKLRTPELREHVVQVAVETLAAEGVTAFTTRRVAGQAATSTNAVYELFGDKAGLVREVFFEGFRLLGARLDRLDRSDDARGDLVALLGSVRAFTVEQPVLAQVMFSRPFADFDPAAHELAAGAVVRDRIVGDVRRAIAAGTLAGDAVDVAHVLLALVQGLAAQESAGWLGSSSASVERRWALAVRATLDGLRPDPATASAPAGPGPRTP